MVLIIILYALFGLSFTIGKITLFYASPFFIVGFRMLLSGLMLTAFLYTQSTKYRPQLKDWPYFLQIAFFGLALPYCLRAWGLQYLSATKAAFIFTLMPFFTALFSYLFYKETLSFRKTTGLMLGFIGMLPTLFTGTIEEDLVGSIAFFSLPELAILGACASFGYKFIAVKNLVQHRKCPIPVANAVTMILGGVMSFNLALITEPIWIISNPVFLFAMIAIQMLISNFISTNLEAWLLKSYSPTFMSFASFIAPLAASLFGWLFLAETMQLHYLISFAMVFLGLALYYSDELDTQVL